jgi:hypothetical protein
MVGTRRLNFKLFRSEKGYCVRFWEDGGSSIEAPFQADLREGGRLSGVIAKIESDVCTRDDLRDLGAEIWTGLNTEPVGRAVAEARRRPDSFFHICFELPPELEQVPWETVYDIEHAIFLAAEPNYCVIRTPNIECGPIPPIKESGEELCLLAAVPEGSGLGIEQELNNLKRAVKLVRSLRVSDLRGRVTPDSIEASLQRIRPDIFHFVGHGQLNSSGDVTIRLNSVEGGQDEFWTTADQFSLPFARPTTRLAVFNCCYGGHAVRTSLSGLGPLLLRRGVPAIVAMRYPIADQIARTFSELFYNALLKGENGGRVDMAIQYARARLFANATADQWRSVVTPVLYLARGQEKLFNVVSPDPEPISPRAAPSFELALPDMLISQFRQQRCVPIVGSGIVAPPTDRLSMVHSTLRALTEHLSQRCEGRDTNLLEAFGQAGFADEQAFQSTAEVFVQEKMQFNLIDAIRLWYENAEPSPAHLALASWRVPALFYTHFDGLIESAFQRQGRAPKIVYTLSKPPDLQQGNPILVLVRGTLTNDASLVLTEQENELLAADIDRLPPTIEQVTTAVMGRSVLLLGVNPRDPIVRKLARRLIRPRTKQGPAFFVCPSFTSADKAYWASLDVGWIEAEPDAVIAKLTALSTG